MDEFQGEEWRPVVGWECRYEVSSLGRVKSNWGGRVRIMKLQYKNTSGRATVMLQLSKENRKRLINVASLVAEAFLGPKPDGMVICHNDGNGLNDSASNLRYDTLKGNCADMYKHGTHPSKLTINDIEWIFSAVGENIHPKVIAEKLEVCVGVVYNVLSGYSWGNILKDKPWYKPRLTKPRKEAKTA